MKRYSARLLHILYTLTILILLSVCFGSLTESYSPTPVPKFTLSLSAPTVSDDFLFSTLGEDIEIYKIVGVYQTSGTITGAVDICDSAGTGCATTTSTLTFNGGSDEYTTFLVSSASNGNTLKWRTESVSGSGFLLITIYYWVN